MKTAFARRFRRHRIPSREGAFFKKQNGEKNFFGDTLSNDHFFHPAVAHSQLSIQRKCEKCEEQDSKAGGVGNKKEEKTVMRTEEKKEEEKLNKKEASTSNAGAKNSVSGYLNSLDGRGRSLPKQQQHFFGSRLQSDFSNVKIHTDKEAADSAKAINAKAYTTGNHIVFNEGQFNDQTREGKKLLAHELTHVLQQNGQQVKRVQMKPEEKWGLPGLKSNEAAEETEAAQNEELMNEPVHVSDITTFGKPSTDTVFAKTVRFTGKTDADFDGGVGQTKNLKAVKAKDCNGCSGNECVTITGTFEITYKVTTNVTLPSVPEGLTTCQNKIVKDAIDNKIAPHEQEHVSVYNAYNGKVRLPINYTGCLDGLQQHLQDLNDADGLARKASAKAASDALDPFFVNVDLDCEEPTVPKK
jgi:hypothetical protein